MGGPLPPGGGPSLKRCGSPKRFGGGRRAGGLRLNFRRGSTMLTLMQAPSTWASCMQAMASSASRAEA